MTLSYRASRSNEVEPGRTCDVAHKSVLASGVFAALISVAAPADAQTPLPPPAPMRLRDRLEIVGGVIFGVGFLPAAVAGAVMPTVIDFESPLKQWYPIEAVPIPVIGPALYGISLLASSACTSTEPSCRTVAGLFLADAVVQLAGAVIMIAGPMVDHDPPRPPVPSTAAVDRRIHWSVGPGPATAPLGLSLRIAHF